MAANVVSAMLREGLVSRTIGQRILFYQELDSTMDQASRLAEEGAEEGAVVVAEVQTAGRGRFGRTWVSPAGNLWLSILLRPSLYALRYLSIMAGVASARAVMETTALPVTLKWPNDLRVNGRKAGGVLVENSLAGSSVLHAVIGIGINVALDADAHGAATSAATSLNAEHGAPVPRELLLQRLLQEADQLYQSLMAGTPPWEEWRSLLDTIGKQVQVQPVTPSGSGGRVYAGIAEDVDAAGNLLLRLANGRRLALPGGEVTMQQEPSAVLT